MQYLKHPEDPDCQPVSPNFRSVLTRPLKSFAAFPVDTFRCEPRDLGLQFPTSRLPIKSPSLLNCYSFGPHPDKSFWVHSGQTRIIPETWVSSEWIRCALDPTGLIIEESKVALETRTRPGAAELHRLGW